MLEERPWAETAVYVFGCKSRNEAHARLQVTVDFLRTLGLIEE